MLIQSLGLQNQIQRAGDRSLLLALGFAATQLGCTPEAPTQFVNGSCRDYRGEVNQIYRDSNPKRTGQDRKEAIHRLARKFSKQFDPSSVEAAAFQEVATIAANRIPCGPLNINGNERYFFAILSSLLFGFGIYTSVASDPEENKLRKGLPTFLFIAAFMASTAQFTNLLGSATSTDPINFTLTKEDCQKAWKEAHKNSGLGPGS